MTVRLKQRSTQPFHTAHLCSRVTNWRTNQSCVSYEPWNRREKGQGKEDSITHRYEKTNKEVSGEHRSFLSVPFSLSESISVPRPRTLLQEAISRGNSVRWARWTEMTHSLTNRYTGVYKASHKILNLERCSPCIALCIVWWELIPRVTRRRILSTFAAS